MLDALPVTQVDVTGFYAADDLAQTLRARGAELMLAGRQTEMIELRMALGIGESNIVARYFPTLAQAVQAYQEMRATQGANSGSPVT